jgi:hypothetical protein
MQTTAKNRGASQGISLLAETLADAGERPQEPEPISARGLEILRVLNDVFNTLPAEAGDWADAGQTNRVPVGAGGL